MNKFKTSLMPAKKKKGHIQTRVYHKHAILRQKGQFDARVPWRAKALFKEHQCKGGLNIPVFC